MQEIAQRSTLSRYIQYDLPLDQQLYHAFANRFRNDLRKVADVQFTNADGESNTLGIRSERVLWLSQFVIEQSQNTDETQEFTTYDFLRLGFPATTSTDPLNQLHKKLPFFINNGLIKPSTSRRFRKYEILKGSSASLKYVESRF